MKHYGIVFAASLSGTLLIGYADYRTGAHISMMLLYAVPILLSSWFCGKREGIVIASVAAACWFIANFFFRLPGESETILSWNAFTRLGIFAMLAYTVSLQARLRRSLEREKLRGDTDSLTGLLNREAYQRRVEEEMERARRYGHPLTFAFIDLDDFKQVNDKYGHAQGDKLLQLVSRTIVNTIRKTDIAGRAGGDEFSVCLPEAGEEEARKVVEKLVKAMVIMTSQSGWRVTVSIGVVICMDMFETFDALIGKGDKLMYAAKEKGKNVAEFLVYRDGCRDSCR